MELQEIILLLVTIVLVAAIFYVSGALVGQDWSASGSYILRLLIVALIAVIVIPVFRNAANEFGLSELGLLLAFVLLIIAVKYIMIDELSVSDDWLAAIVVSLIGVVLIYIVDEVGNRLADVSLLSLF
jgi:peptidoglycan/LPS O-acetylase OafA/YrhL